MILFFDITKIIIRFAKIHLFMEHLKLKKFTPTSSPFETLRSCFRKDVIVNSLVFIVLFFVSLVFYSDFFVAAEQTGTFFYDTDFFHYFGEQPGYLCLYGSLFLIQFFFSKYLASLWVSLLLWGVFILGKAVLKRFRMFMPTLWALIPLVILLAFGDMNAMFLPLALGFLFNFGLFWGLTKIKREGIYALVLIFSLGVSYWVSGGFIWFLGTLVLVDIWAQDKKNKRKWILSALIVLLWGLFPLLTLYLNTELNLWEIFGGLLPSPEATGLYGFAENLRIKMTNYWTYAGLGIFILAGIRYLILLRHPMKKVYVNQLFTFLIYIATLLVYVWVLWWYYPVNVSLFSKWDVMVNEEKWDDLLTSCDAYWVDREEEGYLDRFDEDSDWTASFYTKFALIMTHQLNQKYFSYIFKPHMAPLFASKETVLPYFFTRFYYHMGDTVEAYHVATLNQNSTWRYSPAIFKFLVLANTRTGNYEGNKIALNRLEKTLRYRDFAKKYRDKNLYAKNTMYDSILPLQFDFVINKGDTRIGHLAIENPKNRVASEYLFTVALLEKNITFILGSLNILKQLGYVDLPIHIEEAVLIALEYNLPNSPYNSRTIVGSEFGGFGIRAETLARFDYFNAKYSMVMNGQITHTDFTKEFGGTYWYYYLFGQPTF